MTKKQTRIWLRVLILFCYFLPFVFFHTTCVGASFKVAFNHEEATKNEADAKKFFPEDAAKARDTVDVYNIVDTAKVAETPVNADSVSYGIKGALTDLLTVMITPSKYSLSAFGYFAYFEGGSFGLLIVAAVLSCLLSLILFKWIGKKNIGFIFSSLQLLCMTVVAIHCISSKMDLLWGAWLLLVLLAALTITDAATLKLRKLPPGGT